MESFSNNNINSGLFRNMGIFLFSNSSGHYYLFGFTTEEIIENEKTEEYKKLYNLQIHQFCTIENFNNSSTVIKEIKIDDTNSKKEEISCFITEKQYIMCFYLTRNTTKYYYIIAYNLELEKINETNLYDNSGDKFFYRCIHLKEEVGVFSYYKYYNRENYPILIFKEFSSNQIIDYSFGEINLKKYNFDTYSLNNDLIKLKEDKICFSSILKDDGSIIYIILINLFKYDKNYKVRYYSISLSNIINSIFYFFIRTHNYNNFISFGFSYCNNTFAALMLFSYPNSTDNSSDLYEFLYNNYNSTINDFSVNLWNEVRIENNIFGYIFDSILIQNISDCFNPQLISSLNKSIESNTSLSENELIKLKFIDNNYSSFNCNIEYNLVLTEPDLKIYDQYPESIDGQNEESDDDFKKEEYYGRLTYYYIYLNESLSDNCTYVNCNLCLNSVKSFCITYKYNFTVESSTKEEKNSNKIIDNETVYFTEETEKTNLTYEYQTDEKDSDTTNTTNIIKTEVKINNDTEAFNTEEKEVKSNIDTDIYDKDKDIFNGTNIKKEETTQIDKDKNTDIVTNKDTDKNTTTETQIIINNLSETEIINEITEVKISEVINKDGDDKKH